VSGVRYLVALGVAVAVLDWVDLSTSDIANQLALLVLLVGAGVLGFARPGWAWLAGLALGSALAVTHSLYLAARHPLPYQMHPSGWAGPVTLLVLLLPAFLAAYAGAGAATLAHRRPHSP
jgi:hypothetical protein